MKIHDLLKMNVKDILENIRGCMNQKKKKKEEEEVINLWIYWIYLKDFLIFKIIRIFLNLELKKIFQFLYESKKLIELYKFVKLMT